MSTPIFFWIYMLECENGAYYTGYTKNLTRRFRQHLDGTADAKYTRSHRPVRIAQCWRLYEDVGCALKIEHMVKAATRTVKEKLVDEPTTLRRLAAANLAGEVALFTNPTQEVEQAARALTPEEIKSAADPFAESPRLDL